ncbi:uncharacterized protein LOC107370394 [Tetranychus urticae]|uniref:Uncharacterized protein n=1 Tax=Tetranychus urticae TaxID=32264 RepID=T1L591_TETUR|nr:uncharacterized protein LOC107370394 [Tetranychus urticae]
MKNTIGLIFLFAVFNVSLSLRELDFIGSLYPEGIPKQLLNLLVTRRSNQVKAKSALESIPRDAKTFYIETEQSLQLLLKSMNDTKISDATQYYSDVLELLYHAEKDLKFVNVDFMTVDSRSSLPKGELQAMIDAYADDIAMVLVYEAAFGRLDKVDMEIVDRLKSLSNNLKDLTIYHDSGLAIEELSIARKAMDQCLLQLRFLLHQFTETFLFH